MKGSAGTALSLVGREITSFSPLLVKSTQNRARSWLRDFLLLGGIYIMELLYFPHAIEIKESGEGIKGTAVTAPSLAVHISYEPDGFVLPRLGWLEANPPQLSCSLGSN